MEHVSRRVLGIVVARLAEEPVVALQGPRTVGKSTLLSEVAHRHGVEVIDLDEPAVRDAVTADPATFVAGAPPVCIDEFQKAPVVLDAIKAELNRRLEPGRFVITGSTRFDALPRAAQALTGRIHVIELLPFSQGEIDGGVEDFLAAAMTDPDLLVSLRRSATSRNDYIERICRGGLPLAVARHAESRNRWIDDYVRVSLARDVTEMARIRQGALLPALLRRLAAQTAQVLNMAAAGRRAGLEPRTAETYTKLLEDLFLVRAPRRVGAHTAGAHRSRPEDPRPRQRRGGAAAGSEPGPVGAARPGCAERVRAPARDVRRGRTPQAGVLEWRHRRHRPLADP